QSVQNFLCLDIENISRESQLKEYLQNDLPRRPRGQDGKAGSFRVYVSRDFGLERENQDEEVH
ncbi:unnamed protein product, partial [marine sediment metagenome]